MAKKSSVQVNITIPLEWKQSDIDMIAKARAWAVKAHAGQKDKAGKDYFKAHVTVVAEGVKGDPIAEAVAFLHDTVEDTILTVFGDFYPALNGDFRPPLTPYALYDYLLANNWSVKRKSTRTPVLETTDGSAEIKVPIDLAMADYESRMAEALSELCSCEGIPFSNAIARIVAWKPDKQ